MYKFLDEFFLVKMPTKCFENTFLTQNYFFHRRFESLRPVLIHKHTAHTEHLCLKNRKKQRKCSKMYKFLTESVLVEKSLQNRLKTLS